MTKDEILTALDGISRIECLWNAGISVTYGGKCEEGIVAARKILEELLSLDEKYKEENGPAIKEES